MSSIAIEVKERPILFSAEMVRAILDGRKSQTRRVVKLCSLYDFCAFNGLGNAVFTTDQRTYREMRCLYGQPGELLWVRETWAAV